MPLLIIGIIGFVGFVITGLSNAIPWIASGLFASAFLTLIVITQVKEYFQNEQIEPDTDEQFGDENGESDDSDEDENDNESEYDDDG